MKTCKEPFRHMYLKPGGEGNVTLCNWNWIVVGNLNENSIEEIWNGEKANEVRDAFLRGELLGCDELSCPHCLQQDSYIEIHDEEIQEWAQKRPSLPNSLCIAHDIRCNHACPSCRHELYKPSASYISTMKRIVENIEPYLDQMNLSLLDLNGGGDVFVCKELLDMLSRYNPSNPEFRLILETNGVLFKDSWDKIAHLGHYMRVAVTPNSFHKETYNYLCGGLDNYSKMLESMEFIRALKNDNKVAGFRITMVVQDSNFRELPEFVNKCLNYYNADEVVLRPILRWFGLTEDEWLFKNVANPCHPYYNEYKKIASSPIFRDKRVYDWGFTADHIPIEFPTLEQKRVCDKIRAERNVIGRIIDRLKERIDIIIADKRIEHIVLYGAGKIGKEVLEGLTTGNSSYKIDGFIDQYTALKFYYGYPIKRLYENDYDKDSTIVIATLAKELYHEVRSQIIEAGYQNVIFYDQECEAH